MRLTNTIAIIPARGGSKGIPRKNIRPLAGKPLIAHSIESSLRSSRISRTIVSTEDEEIAGVARAYGAEVVVRPAELATDTASTEPCLFHVVDEVEREGPRVDAVVLLQATSPFRPATLIGDCIAKLENERADSLLTVCPSHHFFWKYAGTTLTATYDPVNRPRRQDLEPRFMENGNVYVTRRDVLMNGKSRLGGKIELFVMDQEDSLEIDSPFDFWLAEAIFTYRETTT